MGDRVQSLAEVEVDNIPCFPSAGHCHGELAEELPRPLDISK